MIYPIEFSTFDEHDSILAALDEVLSNIKDNDDDGELEFSFLDTKKQSHSQFTFFSYAIKADGAEEKLVEIAETLLNEHGIFAVLAEDPSYHALTELFDVLIEKNPAKYHHLGFQYLNEIDRDHDQATFAQMIHTLHDNLGDEKFKEALETWPDVRDHGKYTGDIS